MFKIRLKELRKNKNITQTQLAKIIDVSPQMVSYYETGREPNYDTLKKIADYFGVSLDYLLGRCDIKSFIEIALHEQKLNSLKNKLQRALKILEQEE